MKRAKASPKVRKLCSKASTIQKFRDAIAGSLVAQLDVDPKFIRAIEAALGRNLHAIILKDAKVVSEIIGHLKKRSLGTPRCLFPS